MLKRIVLRFLLVVMVSSFLMISCSRKEETGVITLRWVTDPNPARQGQIALFEKMHPKIKINLDWASQIGGYQKVLTQMAGGTPPDLIDMLGEARFKIFAEKGLLLELTPYCKKYGVEPSIFWEQCGSREKLGYGGRMYHKGRLYAFPNAAGTWVIFYNKKLFDQNKVAYPQEGWTWDDMLRIAKKLTKVDPKKRRYEYFGLAWVPINVVLWSFGGDYYSPDGKRCIVDSPEGKAAYRFCYDLIYKHHVSPTDVEAESIAGAGEGSLGGVTLDLFSGGKFAMMYGSRYCVISLRKVKNLDWDIASVPQGKKRVCAFSAKTVGIANASKHPDEAFQFLKYLTSTEYNKLVCESGDGFPAVRKIAESDIFLKDPLHPEENNKLYIDEMKYSRISFVSPYISKIEEQRILSEEEESMWAKQQTPEETVGKIAERINELIEAQSRK